MEECPIPVRRMRSLSGKKKKKESSPHTCLIFDGGKGTYYCFVDDTVTFKVIGMELNFCLTT